MARRYSSPVCRDPEGRSEAAPALATRSQSDLDKVSSVGEHVEYPPHSWQQNYRANFLSKHQIAISHLNSTVQVRRLTRTDSEEEAEFYLRVLNYPHLLQALVPQF